ncbi:MAG: hypothetical protein V4707_05630 [Pseudomonadota bacterium]
MMLKITGLALAAALTAGAAQAQQTDMKPEDLADLQCVAVFSYIAGVQPEAADQVGVAVFYYLGRLEGRTPGVEWLDRVRTYSNTVSVQDLQGHLERCTNRLVERAEMMQTVGSAMADSAK